MEDEKVFVKIKHNGMKYYVDSRFINKLYSCDIEGVDNKLVDLAEPGKYSSVCLSAKENFVIKRNTLKSFRRRVYTHFGVQRFFNRYSLSDEYRNLKKMSHLNFLPEVYAFGVCSRFPIKEECLIIEYFPDSLTADEMVNKYPVSKVLILEKVFNLYLKAWRAGFAHLDPHPGNVLFLGFNNLKIIDLEACYIDPKGKEFYFGFIMGVFFNYWYGRYLSREEYTEVVLRFICNNCYELDVEVFKKYYRFFKLNKVSRSERMKMFRSARMRAKILRH